MILAGLIRCSAAPALGVMLGTLAWLASSMGGCIRASISQLIWVTFLIVIPKGSVISFYLIGPTSFSRESDLTFQSINTSSPCLKCGQLNTWVAERQMRLKIVRWISSAALRFIRVDGLA